MEVDTLGDEWKGYVLRITGGNDKQGFPMKQGVLSNGKALNIIIFNCIAKDTSCHSPSSEYGNLCIVRRF